MVNKKILVFLTLFLMIFLSAGIFAEANYCCEKTKTGAFCQNQPQSQCDSAFKSSPTSCESTSFCKRGCCFDSQEGICMENTPQRTCSASGGTWSDDAQCNIPQCNLGCCLLGDQGAFVTLTRCKELSSLYALKTDFRPGIIDEVSCIATAQGSDKGACVTEDSATLAKTCKFTTRTECNVGDTTGEISNVTSNKTQIASVGFYKDVLCSSEDLGSICGPTSQTTIVPGKDEVYYLDSCGNTANIYDSSRFNDKQYWKKIYTKEESCGANLNNANSKSCGNCDYFLGSIGKKATSLLNKPVQGDYICADLSCKDLGKKHGESWCVTDSPTGNGLDTVGSRYFKQVCLYDEVITEPCADYRNQICIQGNFNGYSEAACRVNRWQTCMAQVESGDCLNNGTRDCMWIEGYYYSANSKQIEKSINGTTPNGLCVPNYPPGSNFWESYTQGQSALSAANTPATSATSTPAFTATTPAFTATTPSFGTGYVNPSSSGSTGGCSVGNAKLTIQWTMEKRMWPFNDEAWQCSNDACTAYVTDPTSGTITDAEAKVWANDMNQICLRLGDCGGYVNWQNKYTEEGYAAYLDYKRVAGSGGSEIQEKPKTATTTGKVIANLMGDMFGK